ncbi:transcriptional regulator, HxlR family [Granulicella rosea]|uniref:Transcriptional regulator, HxlR family n=1 Tax=Granulicella rosea TaxID=474952 RepID=A0A239J1U9_9BACT|nr:helix-turn-helix domain-containing protein [Granulicella rosea]SNS99642.1 transcriptional regulator, HxlR family [Granulicella rosea]
MRTLVSLQGKWKLHLLWALTVRAARFGELRRALPQTSSKTIHQTLRQLEAADLVSRTDLSDRTLHVEYRLTEGADVAVRELLDHLEAFSRLIAAAPRLEANSVGEGDSDPEPQPQD